MPWSEPANPALGHAIRALREGRELTLEDVAYEANITFGSLSNIELGKQNPRWTTVERIAAALGVTVAELAQRVDRDG